MVAEQIVQMGLNQEKAKISYIATIKNPECLSQVTRSRQINLTPILGPYNWLWTEMPLFGHSTTNHQLCVSFWGNPSSMNYKHVILITLHSLAVLEITGKNKHLYATGRRLPQIAMLPRSWIEMKNKISCLHPAEAIPQRFLNPWTRWKGLSWHFSSFFPCM